ncbi:dnaJ homolog subfamily C member 4 isoform X2 [Ambystoma mexicanum]|uniref:dnaJ homolog subfamily C member 4 isoform X2 n=1 Tax=Ambystoma mexicanum TaxID=8296 RepID=UPI0037E83B90
MNLMLHQFLAIRRCLRCWKGAHNALSTSSTKRPPVRSHYDLLGVQEDASAEDIKQAFFSQSKKLHPDSDPANPHLHTEFVKLNEAYGVLSRENSRREYDLLLKVHREGFSGTTWTDTFSYTSPESKKPSKSSPPTDDERYWQQFYHARFTSEDYSSQSAEQRHKRNKMLVGYCVVLMLGSLLAHYIGFRTIKDVHSNFLEEQNRIFSKIYNDSKESARINGLKKQQEILAQKHAQFAEKYRMRRTKEDSEK